MKVIRLVCCFVSVLLIWAVSGYSKFGSALLEDPAEQEKWKIHDMNRPLPPVVDPGPVQPPRPAPSDAVILFDGEDLSCWKGREGRPAEWKVENGYMEAVKGTGNIKTAQSFGDCQLYLEWRAPTRDEWEGEKLWGNSGVYIMGLYEIQILDSVNNRNYADGVAAAIYGQHPPLVNVCRPPGEWQSFDIIFHRPHFAEDGQLIHPARMTVFHNSTLVHDDVQLTGPTAHNQRPPYKAHADKLPLMLQNYNEPVRFRNIWIREITPVE